MYEPIFEEFASRGIASLSWDKPGVGESTGQFLDQSFDDRADEALSAIESIRDLDEINREQIGLWGISQAGWVMPMICKSRPDISFYIGVSVPGSTVQDQDLFRIRNTLPASGFSSADTDEAAHFAGEVHRLALEDASFEEAIEQLGEYADRPWLPLAFGGVPKPEGLAFLKRIIAVDPADWIGSIDCPVLLVFGEKDTLVNIDEAAAVYEQHLRGRGQADMTMRRFASADHVLTVTQTGRQDEIVAKINGAEWDYISGYVEAMGDWLSNRLGS